MNLQLRDLKKLRWPLAVFLALLAIGGLIAFEARETARQSAAERTAVAARHRQAELRLQQVRTEEQETKEKSAVFLQLTAAGIIGEEKRLEWTELLRQIQTQLHLPGMSYEFAPQTSAGTAESDYRFYASPMKIRLQLLHEEDLLGFIGALQNQAKALVLVRSCTLLRPPGTAAPGIALTADCDMDWITIRSAGNQAKQP